MTKKIFQSIIIVAATVLLASLTIILGVFYEYFGNIQKGQLTDELNLASVSVIKDGVDYLEHLQSDHYRLTWIDTDGTVLYDTETDKLMEFTPETADEAGCMGISPDGKIAVTMDYEEVDDDGIVTGQKQTLRYYDIESGKVIKTVNADDKPALNNFVVYDDGVIQTVPGYNKEKNERTETVVFFDRFDD